ncbi:hypothetical protein CRE_16959 [Caenorhabditis remanei]|uniref:CUT domain-containing protein n=1 Tax=Caenorhabditis remanei TaxID=31234 RepID=E3N2B1_CAERE|nr:hypothetical protein CRE_16959 [Caenorhabditis remanei]
MISFKKVGDQQPADYTLTELTTVQYPFFTHGIHPMRQESITCSERKMLIEEKKFETRRQMKYESGQHPNSKTLLKNEAIFSEPKESTSRQNLRQPSQSSMDSFSSLPLSNASSPSSMTIEQAIRLLTQPTDYESEKWAENMNQGISEAEVSPTEIKEWLGSSSYTNKFFASNILNIKEKNLTNIFAQKRDFNSLRNTKETFIKMYNWLEMSEDVRAEMLKMNLYLYENNESTFRDENGKSRKFYMPQIYNTQIFSEPPKKIIRQDPAIMTAEKIDELMNQPVVYMNTKKVTQDIKEWMARNRTTRKWFAESKESTSRQNLRQPSQSSMDSFSSLPLSNSSNPSPMTVEQSIRFLTQPIPANINVNTTEIVKEIKEWLASSSYTNKYFASNILNIKGNHLTNIFAQPRDFNSLRNTKETFIKMYNWLEMSEDVRTEMLKMNLYEYESPLQDENDTPKKIFRQNPATMTAERIRELMNQPVAYMNTKKVTQDIKEWLARTQTTRKWFATNIVGRAKRTLVINLNYPKEWKELTRGKEAYVRLYNWMRMSEEERQDIMRFYGTENVGELESEDEDSKSLDDILKELRRQFSECNKQ